MKHLAILILASYTFLTLHANAQCTERTKAKIDSIKSQIPYPKFNVGDTLYIAFINDPNKDFYNITEKDIEIKKVKICEMKLYNNVVRDNADNGWGDAFCIDGCLPIEWKYQFIDTALKNPRYKDFSGFHHEYRFSQNIKEAKEVLKKDIDD